MEDESCRLAGIIQFKQANLKHRFISNFVVLLAKPAHHFIVSYDFILVYNSILQLIIRSAFTFLYTFHLAVQDITNSCQLYQK